MSRIAERRLVARTGLVLLSFALSLLVLESVFRLLGIQGSYPKARVDQFLARKGSVTEHVPYGFVPYAIIQSRYDSNPRGYFDPGNKISHSHNSVGWRGVDVATRKDPGVFRILGLGDETLVIVRT